MRVEIQFRNLQTSQPLRNHIERLVWTGLSRFGRRIRSVHVRVGDINGLRGGEEKYCHITCRGAHGTVSIGKSSADPYEAARLAVDRIQRAVGRQLERRRVTQRRALSSTA